MNIVYRSNYFFGQTFLVFKFEEKIAQNNMFYSNYEELNESTVCKRWFLDYSQMISWNGGNRVLIKEIINEGSTYLDNIRTLTNRNAKLCLKR